jgi:galactokinase
MARIGWRAENEWVGIESGLLDQISSAAAIAGHLMLIDFRSLEVQQVEFPSAVEVLIFDSSLRRELTSTAYNDRRAESFDAARILGVDSLRDASLRDVDDSGLSEMLVRRVRHVLNENRMVHDVVDDLGRGDFRAAGQALAKSHESLRDDYETSIPEIDLLVELANGIDGCHGARMTGGGFGGSVVALVEPTASLAIASTILGEFEARSGLKASVLTATPQAGTSVVYP